MKSRKVYLLCGLSSQGYPYQAIFKEGIQSTRGQFNVFMDDENTTKAAWAGFLVSAITVLTSFRPSRDFRLL